MTKRYNKSPLTIDVTKQIQLRARIPSDAQATYDLVQKNWKYLAPWLPWVTKTNSSYDCRSFIASMLDKFEKKTALDLGLYYDGMLIGSVGFNSIDLTNKIGTIGYLIDEEYQGLGIMTAAVKALIKFGHSTYGLHRIEIHADVKNDKSNAIPKRLGFEFEGTMKESRFYNKKFNSMNSWALILKRRSVKK